MPRVVGFDLGLKGAFVAVSGNSVPVLESVNKMPVRRGRTPVTGAVELTPLDANKLYSLLHKIIDPDLAVVEQPPMKMRVPGDDPQQKWRSSIKTICSLHIQQGTVGGAIEMAWPGVKTLKPTSGDWQRIHKGLRGDTKQRAWVYLMNRLQLDLSKADAFTGLELALFDKNGRPNDGIVDAACLAIYGWDRLRTLERGE